METPEHLMQGAYEPAGLMRIPLSKNIKTIELTDGKRR